MSDIRPENIKSLQEAIGKTVWEMTFEQFCQATGFHPASVYASNKFVKLQELNLALGAFDPETLTKILNYPS